MNKNNTWKISKHLLLFPIGLLLILGAALTANAQMSAHIYSDSLIAATAPIPDTSEGYSWELSVIGTKYADGDSQDVYVMKGDESFNPKYHHCNREYLFPVYQNDDSVKMMIYYHMDKFARHTYHVPFNLDFIFEGTLNGVPISSGHLLEGNLESGNYGVLKCPTSVPGLYSLTFQTTVYAGKVMTITVRYLVLKKVEKVIVDPIGFCLEGRSPADNFNFRVKTVPSLTDICPVTPLSHGEWNAALSTCQSKPDHVLKLDFEMASPDSFTAPVYSIISGTGPMSQQNRFNFSDNTAYMGKYIWPLTPGDEQRFFFSYSNLTAVLAYNKTPIVGKVSFNDGLSLTKSTKLYIPIKEKPTAANENNSAGFLIYEYDKTKGGAMSAHTAEPYGTINAPAEEVWTPYDNPMVNEGYGDTITKIQIKDKLVIGKGQKLTIRNMTVEMGKDAEIIVESDATNTTGQNAGVLELDNSTITSYKGCNIGNYTWKGIVLEGNSGRMQDSIGGNFYKRYQAMLYMHNNANISNAEIGVQTADPANKLTRAGGLVYVYNSSFTNNGIAAQFYTYPIIPAARRAYRSLFDNCHFKADDPDVRASFKGFVNGVGIDALPFQSCSFIADYDRNLVGYGISGLDMGAIVQGGVTPCYFKGLHEGIRMERSSLAARGGSFSVQRSTFTGNNTGIHISGQSNAYIAFNTFEVPEIRSKLFFRQTAGMYIETGTGYTVTGNIFRRDASLTSSTTLTNAVLVWNSGSANNFIRKNNVLDLKQGMTSNFVNRNTSLITPTGLQFLCNNQNNNVGINIAAMGTDPGQHGMRAQQGYSNQAAGNTFAHLGLDIYNPSTQVGGVTYFYNADPVLEPTLLVGCTKIATLLSSDCTDDFPFPDRNDPTSAYAYTNDAGMTRILKLHWNISVFKERFEQGTAVQLHEYFTALADPYSDLSNVELYLSEGDITTANTLYNSIVSSRALSGDEAYEFSFYGRKLLDISIDRLGHLPQDLSPIQVSELASIAENATMWAKVRAQNWLKAYDGREYTNTFLYPESDENNTARKALEESITGSQANGLYPNPATDYIDVAYTQISKDAVTEIQLCDVFGRQVLKQSIIGAAVQRIQIDQRAPGIYFYAIRENNAITLKGKLIKK